MRERLGLQISENRETLRERVVEETGDRFDQEWPHVEERFDQMVDE